MKFKKLLSLALASIFIISQPAIAANKENTPIQNNDTLVNSINSNSHITILDSQLKALINKTLDASRTETQDITKAEMESLKRLDNTIGNKKYNITDLSGLEYAINLNTIVFNGDIDKHISIDNVNVIM